MIEINLLEKKEPFKLPMVLGVDLNQINLVMVFIALIIYYIPNIFLSLYLEGEREIETTQIAELQSQNRKVQNEINRNKELKDDLRIYQEQTAKLNARSVQVDEILKLRSNPRKILEKVARSINPDMWFDEMIISKDSELTIKGGTYSSRSLGEFINIMNETPYFAGAMSMTKQENKQENVDDSVLNYDSYELKGKIKNYDMRVQ